MVKRTFFPIAAVLVFFQCSQHNDPVSQGTTEIVPEILWKSGGQLVSPDQVDSIRITVTSASYTKSKTFAYSLHRGVIEDVPQGIRITITIEGIQAPNIV